MPATPSAAPVPVSAPATSAQPVWDVVIIGAGAAGLFCAAQAGQRGLRVLLIDHARRVAEKIRISGGGRCNFTNTGASPAQYISANAHFCRSALARFGAQDFLALVQRHGIAFHEKHRGQLFCDHSAQDIIQMLLDECATGHVTRWQPCQVQRVEPAAGHSAPGQHGQHGQHGQNGQNGQGARTACLEPSGPTQPSEATSPTAPRWHIHTDRGLVRSHALVLATGGLSIPKAGATDFAWRLAQQLGLRTIAPRPGLVPLEFDSAHWQPLVSLAGVSLPVEIRLAAAPDAPAGTAPAQPPAHTPGHASALAPTASTAAPSATAGARTRHQRSTPPRFAEDLLFTHRGLSGPAILQISSYWQPGDALCINLIPDRSSSCTDAPQRPPLLDVLLQAKQATPRKQVSTVVVGWLPARLAQHWLDQHPACQRPLADVPDRALRALCHSLQNWHITPSGSAGFAKAEVTLGGIDTGELSSQTLECRRVPGLYVIGEAVDVTGWLGGYNFQWAWASAHACAVALAGAIRP